MNLEEGGRLEQGEGNHHFTGRQYLRRFSSTASTSTSWAGAPSHCSMRCNCAIRREPSLSAASPKEERPSRAMTAVATALYIRASTLSDGALLAGRLRSRSRVPPSQVT